MLQAINDRIKGIVGGIIIFFLSLTFASWGINEYLTGGKEKYAASVNGADIPVREYEDALGKQRQRLQQIFGDKMPSDPAFEQKMKQQVLDQLVLQRVMSQTVAARNYRISDAMLAEEIKSLEPFQQDGKFSSAMFQQVLGSQGLSLQEFENLYRRDLMAMQMQGGISKSAVLGKATITAYEQLQQQTRDVSYVMLSPAKSLSAIQVSDQELQQYFTEHQDRYQYPEQVSISYLEMSAEHLKTETAVDDEQLRRQYDEYVAGLSGSAERKASHILVSVPVGGDAQARVAARSKAEQVVAELRAGKSFADLAKQYSDDSVSAAQGGDLGWISRGMTDPAFEKSLFALNGKGDVSGVVESGFGYHIIRLDDIKSAKVESFEAKKAELIQMARQHDIDNLFYERSEQLATLAYENDQTLQPAADQLGLKIQNTGMFTRHQGAGVAGHENVRKAAFAEAVLKEGRNSEVIELDKNHLLVLRLNEHQPARPMELREVRAQVEMALKLEKAKQQTMAASLQALADARTGKSMESIAKDYNGDLVRLGTIRRDAANTDTGIVKAAFRMDKPVSGQPSFDSIETPKGMALIAVTSVASASNIMPEQSQAAASLLEGDLAEQEMMAVLDYLKSKSDISIASDLF